MEVAGRTEEGTKRKEARARACGDLRAMLRA